MTAIHLKGNAHQRHIQKRKFIRDLKPDEVLIQHSTAQFTTEQTGPLDILDKHQITHSQGPI